MNKYGQIALRAVALTPMEARAVNRASDKYGSIKDAQERIHRMEQFIDSQRDAMWPLSGWVFAAAALCSVLSTATLAWSFTRRR